MDIAYTPELPAKEELYKLYEELDWNRFLKLSPEQLLKAMQNSYYSIYAYSGNKLIATGRLVSDGMTNAYLCGLCVHNEYRYKRIGTKIVTMLRDYCRENNLHMQFFCEDHLVSYYEKMGFVKFAVGMKDEKG